MNGATDALSLQPRGLASGRSFGAHFETLEVLVQSPDLECSQAAELDAKSVGLLPANRASDGPVLLHGRDTETNVDEGAVGHRRLGDEVHAAQRDVRRNCFELNFFMQQRDGQVTFESFMDAAAGHQKLLALTSEKNGEVHVGE